MSRELCIVVPYQLWRILQEKSKQEKVSVGELVIRALVKVIEEDAKELMEGEESG